MKFEKKLSLKKQTIDNLSSETLAEVQAGGPDCQYPTRKIECDTMPPTYTCGGATCFCLSINPV
jgi:hypothetical protein